MCKFVMTLWETNHGDPQSDVRGYGSVKEGPRSEVRACDDSVEEGSRSDVRDNPV